MFCLPLWLLNGLIHHRDTEDTEVAQRRTMRRTKMKLNDLSHEVIGAAIEIHRKLGPGLLELTCDRRREFPCY